MQQHEHNGQENKRPAHKLKSFNNSGLFVATSDKHLAFKKAI
jgi:hypothetical protein